MSKLTFTVVEIANEALYRAANLPTDPEAEFTRLFGRDPDEDDRAYGLQSAIRDMQWIAEMGVVSP